MLKLLASLAAVLLVAACATQSVDTSYSLDPKSRDGVVTGSISYSGRFSGYSVHYKNLSTGETGRFQIGQAQALLPISPKSEFDEPDVVGMVFAVPLPAGDYEVSRWSVGSGAANVFSTAPFSIKFKVEPGRSIYVGSFQFTQTASRGLTVTGASLVYKDAAARDLPIMRKKFPNLRSAELASAVAPRTDLHDVGGTSDMRFTPPVFLPVVPR